MRILERLVGGGSGSRPFVALVSPSVRTLLPAAYGSLNTLLKGEGALAVDPVDAGIPEFARRSAQAAAAREAVGPGGGLHILSACPMALRFVRKRHPAHAASLLRVPSPMVLQAEEALTRVGIRGQGYALAVTPCAYKRLEAPSAPVELRVVELARLLGALAASGIRLDGYPASRYDLEPRAEGSACPIAETVVKEARALGLRARPVRLDGPRAATRFLEGGEPAAATAAGELLFSEITFCEGGCGRFFPPTEPGMPRTCRPCPSHG